MERARNPYQWRIQRSSYQQYRRDRAAMCAARQATTASEIDQQAVV
jgi:hypothetical protein